MEPKYTRDEIELLIFIYERLKCVHRENENCDYMRQLRSLIGVITEPKSKLGMPKELKNDRDVLQALLDGETIQQCIDTKIVGEWYLGKDGTVIYPKCAEVIPRYIKGVCVKPKTININGYEVPEPLREEPEENELCYYAFVGAEPYKFNYKPQDESNVIWLKMGMLHSNYENAQKHREALLSFTALKKKV